MDPVCKICLEEFNAINQIPRVCTKCGRSICQRCIRGIAEKKRTYQCPYCKYTTPELWPKNLELLQGLQQQGLLCAQHKKKIINFCASQNCKESIGICDATECSLKHKEKGTNILPLSLLKQPLKQKVQYQEINSLVQGINNQASIIIKNIMEKSKSTAKFVVGALKLSDQSAKTFKLLSEYKVQQISSKQISLLKKQIIQKEDQQQKQTLQKSFEQYKKKLAQEIYEGIMKIKIQQIEKLKQIQEKKEVFPNEMISSNVAIIPQKKIQQLVIQFLSGFLNKNMKIKEIYNSKKTSANIFKQIMANKSRILYLVQTDDGSVFGVYQDKEYPARIMRDVDLNDPKSYAFFYNQKRIFPAKSGGCHFDFSKQYLFSTGNTGRFDGFYFHKDFEYVNKEKKENHNGTLIWSEQFVDMKIQLSSRRVTLFRVFSVFI